MKYALAISTSNSPGHAKLVDAKAILLAGLRLAPWGLIILGACSESVEPAKNGPASKVDSGTFADAGSSSAVDARSENSSSAPNTLCSLLPCDPIHNTGCPTGENCNAYFTDIVADGKKITAKCGPQGTLKTLNPGPECQADPTGADGACAPGFACMKTGKISICMDLCDPSVPGTGKSGTGQDAIVLNSPQCTDYPFSGPHCFPTNCGGMCDNLNGFSK